MDLQPDIPEAKRVPKAQLERISQKKFAELLFGEKNTPSPKVSNKTNDYVRLRLFETFFY